jgi:hypothetical protein
VSGSAGREKKNNHLPNMVIKKLNQTTGGEKNNHLPNMVFKNLNQTTIFSVQNPQALIFAIETPEKS